MKKFLSVIFAILILTTSFAMADTLTIGILQFAPHPSLDNCRIGFIEGLKAQGFEEGKNIEIIYQNSEADMALTNQMAQQLADKCDLICAIATPAAQAAFNAAMDKNVPVIYSAVSDPISAGLAKEDGTNDNNITGTSDVLPVEAQLALIREVLPEASKIGILYSTSETNSESTLKTYKELAPNYGFEILEEGIGVGADIPLALGSLLPKVDCTSNLTDNTVVTALPLVLELSKEAGKPVFGSEIEQVKNGCIGAAGIEYVELGKQTGEMAARVLNGEFAGSIPFEAIKNSFLYINSIALEEYGIEISQDLLDKSLDVAVK
ncbi:MAG: ABC transporter substrate-binding protein [Christensenellaceae bacterium]|nr:ABC transporter substrate-binding protein [Christensenellaceae bacterium]